MVRREVRTHCSIVRLAKQRESLGVGCLADLATLPPACRKGFVEEWFSARVPKSSAEVRRAIIHDSKEVEVVRQQEQQDDKRENEEGDEVKGEVEEIRSNAHSAHET